MAVIEVVAVADRPMRHYNGLVNCPMGVDLATFNRMARGLLVSVGIMPEGVAVVSKDQWEVGNQMGVLKEEYLDTLEWMAEELQDELDDPEVTIPVDKTRNTVPVTFHDSGNNARSCGLFEEPRELPDLVVTDFREMYPNRAENYCCTGGGGAMSMSEYTPQRFIFVSDYSMDSLKSSP